MSRRKSKRKTVRAAVVHSRPAGAAFLADGRKNLPADARTLIADAKNDITIPFYSGVLQHVDDTLIQQGGGKGLLRLACGF